MLVFIHWRTASSDGDVLFSRLILPTVFVVNCSPSSGGCFWNRRSPASLPADDLCPLKKLGKIVLLTYRRMPLSRIRRGLPLIVRCWLSSRFGNTMFHHKRFWYCWKCSGGWSTNPYGWV